MPLSGVGGEDEIVDPERVRCSPQRVSSKSELNGTVLVKVSSPSWSARRSTGFVGWGLKVVGGRWSMDGARMGADPNQRREGRNHGFEREMADLHEEIGE